jgi:hypothetical protein
MIHWSDHCILGPFLRPVKKKNIKKRKYVITEAEAAFFLESPSLSYYLFSLRIAFWICPAIPNEKKQRPV